MKLLVLPVGILLPAASVVGGAQTVPPKVAGDPPTNSPAKERKVCRTEIETGSLMPKRKCATRAEWVAIDRVSQATADSLLDRRGHSGTTRE